MNRTLRHTNVPSGARAMDEFFRVATRAKQLGFNMREWLDRYMPPSNATANEIYARVFLARDAVNERENP